MVLQCLLGHKSNRLEGTSWLMLPRLGFFFAREEGRSGFVK
uniref:Rad51b n=1 Tax=Arundo donax TaxID=35708 RepID=A0A0A9DUK7_ARUDO